MTDEQINAAIAEACGWTECRLVAKVALSALRDPVAYGVPPNGTYEIACLNYCADLNAMHAAEKVFVQEAEWVRYSGKLAKVTNSKWSNDMEYICATARQRAEAFLRTLGKWSATDKESLTVGATSSGGSGGSGLLGWEYQERLGPLPPETRITVNAKTFCLADIDKEMTE